YYREAGLRHDDVVPEYREIAGQYYDAFNRPLRVPPTLHFVTCDRLRFGVGTLEEFAKQTQMQNFANPATIDVIREEFRVEVVRFCFSPIAVAEIVGAIRGRALEMIRELEQYAQT